MDGFYTYIFIKMFCQACLEKENRPWKWALVIEINVPVWMLKKYFKKDGGKE